MLPGVAVEAQATNLDAIAREHDTPPAFAGEAVEQFGRRCVGGYNPTAVRAAAIGSPEPKQVFHLVSLYRLAEETVYTGKPSRGNGACHAQAVLFQPGLMLHALRRSCSVGYMTTEMAFGADGEQFAALTNLMYAVRHGYAGDAEECGDILYRHEGPDVDDDSRTLARVLMAYFGIRFEGKQPVHAPASGCRFADEAGNCDFHDVRHANALVDEVASEMRPEES